MLGWRTVRLEEIAELITKGTTPTSVGFEFIDDGINFIKVESLSEDGRFLPDKFAHIDTACHAALRRSQLRTGDILFSIAGALGRCAVVTPEVLPANTNQALAIIRLHPGIDVDPAFLMLALTTAATHTQIAKFKGGAAQQNLSLAQMRSMTLRLPLLSEQKRIVAILDEAFEGIRIATTNAEKNLANSGELRASTMHAALDRGWPTVPITEFLISGRAISYGVVKPGRHDAKGVRLIKSQQVRDGWMDLTEDFRITAELDAEYRRTRLQGGEVLLNLVGASIGRSAIAPLEIRGANVSRAIAVIPVRPEWARWVQYSLHSFVGQRLISRRTGGAAQPVLNLAEVKTLPVPNPTAKERDATVLLLDRASHDGALLEQTYSDRQLRYHTLKQSILGRAFAGQLTATRGLAA